MLDATLATSTAPVAPERPSVAELLATIPAQRAAAPATLRDRGPRYDRAIAAAADDIACAVSAAHRSAVAFAERDDRDLQRGEHHGAGARHRRPGPPCDRLERTRPAGRPAGQTGPAR